MLVIKRDGKEVQFDEQKIINAISAANKEVPEKDKIDEKEIDVIANSIYQKGIELDHSLHVEDIQDLVEDELNSRRLFNLARHYSRYRFNHARLRETNTIDNAILSLIDYANEEIKQENSNKNPRVTSVQRDYIAGEVSKDMVDRYVLPEDIVEAHNEGIIHFHDKDYFIHKGMPNCCLVNLEDMLNNGTMINGVLIEKPHSFSTACTIASQIAHSVSSSQYGGQTINIAHLSPFVDVSRQYFRKYLVEDFGYEDYDSLPGPVKNRIDVIVEREVAREITKGVQTIQYQVITLQGSNGQAPFITIALNINDAPEGQQRDDLAKVIAEVIKQRYKGVKNANGVYVTTAFPKLIYFLDDNNITPDSEYYWLTCMAARCTAKRMVPDYISAKKMREYKIDKNGNGNVYSCMGCRAFLTPYVDENNQPKYYGRFNSGVCTISLPDVALSSGGDIDKFWEIMEERLELCHKALQCRHKRLRGALSNVAPILFQHGAYARLAIDEPIDKLLFNGYSTISLGYAGLYECVKYMTGKSHSDPEAKPFALSVMQKLNDKCAEWKDAEHIDYSVYGAPIESTTYRFAKCLKKRFGVIEGITDRNYITNSYHIPVFEEIDAFEKLKLESEFQKLSPGGAISYIEAGNLENNIEAILEVLKFIYDTIMYAEINIKSDYCSECGYDGEIKIIEENGKLIWECPNCGNRDQNKMNVARRTCGYIGSDFWNQGRTQEIKERVLHLDNFDYCCED